MRNLLYVTYLVTSPHLYTNIRPFVQLILIDRPFCKSSIKFVKNLEHQRCVHIFMEISLKRIDTSFEHVRTLLSHGFD